MPFEQRVPDLDTLPAEFHGALHVLQWSKAVGDRLSFGDIVVELVTPTEHILVLAADRDGSLLEQCVAVGEPVMPGGSLFRAKTRDELEFDEAREKLIRAQVNLTSPIDLALLPAQLEAFKDAALRAGVVLNPGATDSQLNALEAKFGWPLPSSLRALYKAFNGCGVDEYGDASHLGNQGVIFSLKDIAEMADMWNDIRATQISSAEENGNGRYWHPSWIPFIDRFSYAIVVIDPTGCFQGPPGQVISFDYKSGPETWIVHRSFDEWLRCLLASWQAGLLFLAEDEMTFEQSTLLHVIGQCTSEGVSRQVGEEADVFC